MVFRKSAYIINIFVVFFLLRDAVITAVPQNNRTHNLYEAVSLADVWHEEEPSSSAIVDPLFSHPPHHYLRFRKHK